MKQQKSITSLPSTALMRDHSVAGYNNNNISIRKYQSDLQESMKKYRKMSSLLTTAASSSSSAMINDKNETKTLLNESSPESCKSTTTFVVLPATTTLSSSSTISSSTVSTSALAPQVQQHYPHQIASGKISNTSNQTTASSLPPSTSVTSSSVPTISAKVGNYRQNYLTNISLANNMMVNNQNNNLQHQLHQHHNYHPHNYHDQTSHHYQLHQNQSQQQQNKLPLLNNLLMMDSSTSTINQQNQSTLASQQIINDNHLTSNHQHLPNQQPQQLQPQTYQINHEPILIDNNNINDFNDLLYCNKLNSNVNNNEQQQQQQQSSSLLSLFAGKLTGNHLYRLNGIGELLASLALMCILSLLMAFLALTFIQRSFSFQQLHSTSLLSTTASTAPETISSISNSNNNSKQSRFYHYPPSTLTNSMTNQNQPLQHQQQQFNQKIVSNTKEYLKVFQISISLSTLTIALDLCCLFVCCIQFLSIIKLLKTPFGFRRSFEFIKKTSHIRIISIGAFLVSIPIFFTGIILYTFVNFDEIPALITSIIIGLGIIFCGIASVQNVYLWQWEKTKASQDMQEFHQHQQQELLQQQQQQQQQRQSSFYGPNNPNQNLNQNLSASSMTYQQQQPLELSTLV